MCFSGMSQIDLPFETSLIAVNRADVETTRIQKVRENILFGDQDTSLE